MKLCIFPEYHLCQFMKTNKIPMRVLSALCRVDSLAYTIRKMSYKGVHGRCVVGALVSFE